jgi:L-histidine N-alpha-methyltransferase
MTGEDGAVEIEVFLQPGDLAAALRQDVRAGLALRPRRISPKWHYDEVGSRLFEQITRLDEYYPTRRERDILTEATPAVVEAAGADTLAEIGSGFSEKTRILLDAMAQTGRLRRYTPFDVSEAALREAAASIAHRYPGVAVHGIVGDFEHHLGHLPRGGTRLIAFLGGTIGNLYPEQRAALLRAVATGMKRSDRFLLGADMVKDRGRLEAAYDDTAGVSASFSRNVLAVLNRELDADFDLRGFRHDAVWDEQNEWMDIGLVALSDQTVHFRVLETAATFAAGEKLHTEISAKFRPAGLSAELLAVGLVSERVWTDPDGDYSLTLARPA